MPSALLGIWYAIRHLIVSFPLLATTVQASVKTSSYTTLMVTPTNCATKVKTVLQILAIHTMIVIISQMLLVPYQFASQAHVWQVIRVQITTFGCVIRVTGQKILISATSGLKNVRELPLVRHIRSVLNCFTMGRESIYPTVMPLVNALRNRARYTLIAKNSALIPMVCLLFVIKASVKVLRDAYRIMLEIVVPRKTTMELSIILVTPVLVDV
mmetsp:Transcript_39713/g.45240  ORF Transcript_39713/g.45240 Transcript_39713/m.45240 type:complete len:213 (-) Transcript_39713:229-867(-)